MTVKSVYLRSERLPLLTKGASPTNIITIHVAPLRSSDSEPTVRRTSHKAQAPGSRDLEPAARAYGS
jgi:hypothetical protein